MRLSDAERTAYNQDGYLLMPELLRQEEVALLREKLPELLAEEGPHVKRDAEGAPPKIVYAPHVSQEPYRLLCRVPRLLGTVTELLDDDAYIYQSRINLKMPFAGDAWSWHQDFSAWHRGDGLPEPRAIMVAVFLHDCTPANGPLLVIPGSHRSAMDEILAREKDVQGYADERVTTETLKALADRTGIQDLCGKAGTVAFIHPTLLHGSATNMTPWPRSILYFNYNACSNYPRAPKRAWFMNNPDTSALQPVSDEALLDLTRVPA